MDIRIGYHAWLVYKIYKIEGERRGNTFQEKLLFILHLNDCKNLFFVHVIQLLLIFIEFSNCFYN